VQQIARESEFAMKQQRIQAEMRNAEQQNKFNNNNKNYISYKYCENQENNNNNNSSNYYNDSTDASASEKGIKIAFALFCENTIYFAYLDQKTSELKFSAMSDLTEPFNPVARSAFFFSSNFLLNQTFYETLTEKLFNFCVTRNKLNFTNQTTTINTVNKGTAFSASLFAGLECFNAASELSSSQKKTFNHMHIFTCNKNSSGAGYFAESDYIRSYSSESEIKLFLPEQRVSAVLLDKMLSNGVTLNCFISGFTQAKYLDLQINLPTFFEVCSKTGGKGFYYSTVNKTETFNEDVKLGYQKLHYDLSAVLNKKVFYNVLISLKHSSEFFVSDVFYSVGNSLNSTYNHGYSSSALESLTSLGTNLLNNFSGGGTNKAISSSISNTTSGNFNNNCAIEKGVVFLPSVNSDFNLLYNFKYSKTLKEDKKYSFQFIVSYIDPLEDNVRKIRVFNYGVYPNEIFFKVYSYLDIDAMMKLIFVKEVADALTNKNNNVCCFEKVKENLKKRLIDALYFYKKNVRSIFI